MKLKVSVSLSARVESLFCLNEAGSVKDETIGIHYLHLPYPPMSAFAKQMQQEKIND